MPCLLYFIYGYSSDERDLEAFRGSNLVEIYDETLLMNGGSVRSLSKMIIPIAIFKRTTNTPLAILDWLKDLSREHVSNFILSIKLSSSSGFIYQQLL